MLQKPLHFLLKIEVLKDDGKTILDTLKGVVIGGTASIDSASSIRRTFSASLIPTLHDNNNTKITEEGLVWLNKELRIYVGVMDIRTGTYTYYPLGHYVYTSSSGSYDAATNQLTITCSDYMSKLDGTKNGQIGAFSSYSRIRGKCANRRNHQTQYYTRGGDLRSKTIRRNRPLYGR